MPDNPGEAAFQVTVDIDTGDGFAPLADLSTVTTGATLQHMAGDEEARLRWAARAPRVFETFSWEKASQRFKQTYQKLLDL